MAGSRKLNRNLDGLRLNHLVRLVVMDVGMCGMSLSDLRHNHLTRWLGMDGLRRIWVV